MKELRFDGRVALLTGAGSGIARELAYLLAARGAKLVLNGRPQTIENVEKVANEIIANGGEAVVCPGIVGEDEAARAMVKMAIDTYGRLDIVGNIAGLPGQNAYIQNAPAEMFDPQFNVHVRGPLQINRAAYPYMKAQNYGRILFVGSSCAIGYLNGGGPEMYECDYSMCKSGLFAVNRNTAATGKPFNIKSNMLMPWAYTKMVEKVLKGTELGEWMKANMTAEIVAKSILPFIHEDTPCSGEAITCVSGRVGRCTFAMSNGYWNPDLTPEDVMENWDKVRGREDDEGCMIDMFEASNPRENVLILGLLEAQATGKWDKKLDSIKWLQDSPIDGIPISLDGACTKMDDAPLLDR